MSVQPLMLSVLGGTPSKKPPVWLMRQAGRYLPEYRELRAKTKDFLEFCYTPDIATEATLQPIRRFGFDASILFSDILVVPHGLGQKVWFESGEGPRLEKPETIHALLDQLSVDRMEQFLQPVYQATRQIRAALPAHTPLIGFSAAPWTLACYMLEGRGSRDYPSARAAAYATPSAFAKLIRVLEQGIIRHLECQIQAGAAIVQLFDSWAGACPSAWANHAMLDPAARIVRALRSKYPHVPVIGFPKGIGATFASYAAATGVQAMGVDYHSSLEQARAATPDSLVLQGNLDPELLASGSIESIKNATAMMRETMEGRPYIANLGHGIVPHTPMAHVEAFLDALRR